MEHLGFDCIFSRFFFKFRVLHEFSHLPFHVFLLLSMIAYLRIFRAQILILLKGMHNAKMTESKLMDKVSSLNNRQ